MEKLDLQLAQQWIKANRRLLKKHKGEWIAYNGEDGIIEHDKSAEALINKADKLGKNYIIRFLHPYTYSGLPRLLPVRFRALRNEIWEPMKSVKITFRGQAKVLDLLVDSGADISTVSFSIGRELGFNLFDEERPQRAAGIGGSVDYVIRDVQMELEGHTFTAPVAWFLDENCDDLLLGREVVFDLFNIEFRQPDEEIIFTKRETPAA